MKRIVILGGGFGGVYTLIYLNKIFKRLFVTRIKNRLKKINNEEIQIVLVSDNKYFLFTPFLHEIATGSVSLNSAICSLDEISKNYKSKFLYGKVVKIDLKEKFIYINLFEDDSDTFSKYELNLSSSNSNYKISYDYLVISTGSKTNFYNIPGVDKYCYDLKTIEHTLRLKKHFIEMFNLSLKDIDNAYKYLTFVVVGGGATGVEIISEMSSLFYQYFKKKFDLGLISKVKLILIERGKDILYQFSPEIRKKALDRLKKLKIDVYLEKGVIEVGEDFIKLDDNKIIPTKTVVWTAGIKPNLPEIVGNVEKDERKRLMANQYLQLKNYNEVFILGDMCCFLQNGQALPQLAQVATKEAFLVASNILNLIFNRPLKKFNYQHSGSLISVGHFYALGEVGKFKISGFFVWFLYKSVYLFKIICFKNRLRYLADWFLNILSRSFID
jgi:NADH dehydrogenase